MFAIKEFNCFDDFNKICNTLQKLNNKSHIETCTKDGEIYPVKVPGKESEINPKVIDLTIKFFEGNALLSKKHRKASIATIRVLQEHSNNEEIQSKFVESIDKIKSFKQKTSPKQEVENAQKEVKENAEFIFHCRDGKTVKSHASFLNNPLFDVRSEEWKEQLLKAKSYDLQEFSKEVVKLFLNFIKGDTLPEDLNVEDMIWIYSLADYFLLEKVKQSTSQAFQNYLNDDGDKFLDAVMLTYSMIEKIESESTEEKEKEQTAHLSPIDPFLVALQETFYQSKLVHSITAQKAKQFIGNFEPSTLDQDNLLIFLIGECCQKKGEKKFRKSILTF